MGCDDDFLHRSQSSMPPTSSSESSFRELEDAFLQTQTRIWLGEVLQIRLDENLIISEGLSDGELLFQVSKVVWRWLLAKHVELRHVKPYQHQPFASKENSGRYRPYSNVDSFLKICKILGLTGIDLFSPSDVVEQRNTRKVCMCIRSFSKKARSKNVNVPDFDVVSCTITMPKDMVGYIRRNLELSQNSPADSPYNLQKHEEGKHNQGYSVSASPKDYETYLDEYDATEINHAELKSESEFDFLSSEKSLHPSSVNIEQESGFMDFGYSEESLFGRRDALEQVATSNLEELSTSNVHHSASSHGSNSTPGSIEHDSKYFDICDNIEVLRNWSMEPVNLSNEFDEQDNLQKIESFEIHDDKVDQWNHIIEGYKSQDSMEYTKTAYEITSDAKHLQSVEKFEDSKNSIYYNASFLESEDLLSLQSYLSSEFCKWDQKGKCALVSPNNDRSISLSFPKVGSCEENTPCARHEASEVIQSEQNEKEAAVKLDIDDKQSNKDFQVVLSNVVGKDCHEKCPSNEEDTTERVLHVVTNEDLSHDTRSCLTNECSKLECKDIDQEFTIDTCLPDEKTLEADKASSEESIEKPKGKPSNNIMLKSALGGTAVVGMLVMFLHLRRTSGGKSPKSIKSSSGDTAKDKVKKSAAQKTQRSTTEGVYPAEKLKLGD